jgi:hypothetical protein
LMAEKKLEKKAKDGMTLEEKILFAKLPPA